MSVHKIKKGISKSFSLAVPLSIIRQCLDIIVKAISFKTGSFVTFAERPTSHRSMIGFQADSSELPTGIVVQGQYVTESDFTKNTVLMYRSYFPKAAIVVSSWKGQIPSDDRAAYEAAGILVVESTPPEKSGILNINFQLRSTNAGLQEIRKHRPDVQFILKVRTDQRFYQSNLISHFESLRKVYGKSKLVALSFNSKRRLFGSVSDMMIYGSLSEVQKYFSPAEQDVSVTMAEFTRESPRRLNPEQTFFQAFVGEAPKSSEQSDKLVVDNFILVDKEMADLYWHKYSNLENRKLYNTATEDANWSFLEYATLFAKRNF